MTPPDIEATVNDAGWETRIDRALLGWFWLTAKNGELRSIGWRATKRGAKRAAEASLEREPGLKRALFP